MKGDDTQAMGEELRIVSGFGDSEDRQFTVSVIRLSLIAIVLAAIVFTVFPGLDVLVHSLIWQDGGFVLDGDPFWSGFRQFLLDFTKLFYLVCVVAVVLALRSNRRVLGLASDAWGYILICSLLGPGLLVNLILKAFIPRPRPREVADFGGSLDFVSIPGFSGACDSNCSFVSGEVASTVMMLAALAFVLPSRRPLIAFLVLPAWLIVGAMRMGQGGHFLSDVLFSGLFMILLSAVIFRLCFIAPPELPESWKARMQGWLAPDGKTRS
jgi:lipid A 4'-phosphatase